LKTVIGKTVGIAIALVGLLLGSPAYADSISYTVGGWSGQFPGSVTPPAGATWGTDGYPGDTVELQTYTGTLTLASGTYYQKINTLLWTIDYTYGGTSVPWGNMDFTFDALRNMSFNGGPSGAIEQSGQLVSGWENDSLGFSDGSTVSFVVSGYRIDITPLGLAQVDGANFSGDNPWTQPNRDVLAKFEVTAVPDAGSTLTLLGLALIGLCGMTRRFQVI